MLLVQEKAMNNVPNESNFGETCVGSEILGLWTEVHQ